MGTGMQSVQKKPQFILGIAVILLTLSWLAYSGIQESKTYYVTVSELLANSSGDHRRLRVAGDVIPGSIQRNDGRVRFQIIEQEQVLPVIYVGTEPLPDTLFNDGAQAIADGRYQNDGVFHAEAIQAKCPSKYEAAASQESDATKPSAY
jgi:cytochrome c-type biogenesis protein CcmE